MFEAAIVIVISLVGFVALTVVLGSILAFPTMWLWNWLMPALFHLPVITVWQAWGLLFLSALLFKPGSPESSSKKKS